MQGIKINFMQQSNFVVAVVLAIIFITACNSAESAEKQGNADGIKDTVVLTEQVRYNMSGQPFMRSLFKYNEEGLLVKEVMWDSSSMGVRIRNRYIKYQEDKPVVVTMKDPQGNEIYTINYSYNDAGLLTKEIYKDDAGTTVKVQEYNSKNQPVKKIITDQAGNKTVATYTYNAAGKIDTATQYLPDGSIQQRNVYLYKDDTLMTDCLFLNGEDSVYLHWTYSYTPDGQLESEYEMAPNGTQYVIKRYFYNDAGQKVREESYKGRMYTMQYFYRPDSTLGEVRMVDNAGAIRSISYYKPLKEALSEYEQ